MDGVVVLNTISYVSPAVLFICGLIGGLLGLLFFAFMIKYYLDWNEIVVGTLSSLIIFGLVIGGVFLGTILQKGETHYEVTIDDSVSMSEFDEKYEIIEQRGEIYTVKERE